MKTLRIEEAPNGWIVYKDTPRTGMIPSILGVYNDIDDMNKAVKKYMAKPILNNPNKDAMD